jgi:TonB family protein
VTRYWPPPRQLRRWAACGLTAPFDTQLMNFRRLKLPSGLGLRSFVAVLAVLCCTCICQGQTVASSTCDFSRYKPFTMSHFLNAALIEQAKPLYPAMGKNVRVQGDVRVKILVDRSGRVRSACAVDGHPLLQASAVWAARNSRFKPNFGLSLPQKRYGRRFVQDGLMFKFRLE